MKKFNILLVFSLAVSMSFAQLAIDSRQINMERFNLLPGISTDFAALEKAEEFVSFANKEITASDVEFEAVAFSDLASAFKLRSVASELDVWYSPPSGVLFGGFLRDYRLFNAFRVHAPAMTPLVFRPSATETATFTWTLDNEANTPIEDGVAANGILTFEYPLTAAASFFLPRVTATTASATASYAMGDNVADGNLMLASFVGRIAQVEGSQELEFHSLTMANAWENRPGGGNLFTGFQAGYAFSPQYSNADGPVRGVMQIIPPLASPLWVESMSILAGSSTPVIVPDGGEMRLELFYLNENGTIGEKIAESTTREFVPTANASQGAFVFQFEEQAGPFRIPNFFAIEAGRAFIVRVTGFDATWNFNFLMGTAEFGGHSYTLHGDNLAIHSFNFPGTNVPRADMYIQFNGIFNCLVAFDDEIVVVFPAAGGIGITGANNQGQNFNDFPIFSAFNFLDPAVEDSLRIIVPNWINEVEIDADLFASRRAMLMFFSAEPLPSGMTERSGEVVISLYGVSVTIPVVQEGGTNVSNPTISNVNVFVSEGAFELNYTSDFTTVTIFNIAGQAVRVLDLPTNGNVVIPTADLARGAYIVRFAGAKVESVKVIK